MKTAFEKMRQGRARCEAAQKRIAIPAAIISMGSFLQRPLTYEEKKQFEAHRWVSINTERENPGVTTRLVGRPWYRRLWGHFFGPTHDGGFY